MRTGRANPALLDGLQVDYYGTPTPLQQLANLGAPDPRLIVISPYDKGAIGEIEKAIRTANLGLTPQNDGKLIRIPIPALTEERRKDMVKLVGKLTEEGRVHVRQVRHDVNKDVKHKQDDGSLSEDDAKRLIADVQKLTDRYVTMLDEVLKKNNSSTSADL